LIDWFHNRPPVFCPLLPPVDVQPPRAVHGDEDAVVIYPSQLDDLFDPFDTQDFSSPLIDVPREEQNEEVESILVDLGMLFSGKVTFHVGEGASDDIIATARLLGEESVWASIKFHVRVYKEAQDDISFGRRAIDVVNYFFKKGLFAATLLESAPELVIGVWTQRPPIRTGNRALDFVTVL